MNMFLSDSHKMTAFPWRIPIRYSAHNAAAVSAAAADQVQDQGKGGEGGGEEKRKDQNDTKRVPMSF